MVGGLVEDEEVLCAREEPRKDGSCFLAAGHRFELALLIFTRKEECTSDGAGFEFGEGDFLVGVLFDGVLDVADDRFGHVHIVVGLGEVPDIEICAEFDGSLIRVLLAEDAADEGGLARSVGTDDPPALSTLDAEVEVFEEYFV